MKHPHAWNLDRKEEIGGGNRRIGPIGEQLYKWPRFIMEISASRRGNKKE
jgi:hypothetical protein